MNSIFKLRWPYDIGRLPTNIRGTFRLRIGSEASVSVNWPPEPSPSQIQTPVVDGALAQMQSAGQFSVLQFNDAIQIEFTGEREPLVVICDATGVDDRPTEQSFDNGETWEPLPITVENVQ